VNSTLENIEDTPGKRLVKLSVTIDEAEFDRDIDRAFRKLANEVRLPGFRQGKVPRKVLEARIGLGPAREQALRDGIPVYLAGAVREHDIDLIDTPQVEITGGEEAGPISFDATCEVRPEITVPGYGGLRVEVPAPTASDEEVEDVVKGELRRHGSLVDVDRAVESGDQVTLTLAAFREGEPVPGLNTEDWLYEVGRGWVAEGFDDQLIGADKGAELRFTATPNGTEQPADFEVTVSNVQETVLPEFNDDWVDENIANCSTVDEYRASIVERLSANKLNQVRNVFIDRITSALAELVEIDAPDAMVRGDLQGRVQNTVQQFQAQGISIDQWLQATGQSSDDFVAALRVQSEKAVKVDLALRAVADAEGIEVSDDDVDREYERIAMQVRQKKNQVRRAYEANDAVTDLIAQLRKNKALDFLVHSVEVVDPEGNPVDRHLIIGDHDRDHDHDHDNDDDHDDDSDHEGHDHD
jgi:trigger factor